MKLLQKYLAKRRFDVTPEPPAKVSKPKSGKLTFVIQKHLASHLHYDLRLELYGVLKSWAVPKGPSLNPTDKRLAMMVEDHPYDYRTFEGNIPKGEYGAGPVMVWDEGTYEVDNANTKKEAEKIVAEALHKGHLELTFHGQKLHGKFVLVKTQLYAKQQNAWLLIKMKDEFASKKDITLFDRSVKSNRSMEEIQEEKRSPSRTPKKAASNPDPVPDIIQPMLAFLIKEPFDQKGWLFEVKWDGYRAITYIQNEDVKIFSRNQESFNARFPDLVSELQRLSVSTAILDGEIVVTDDIGRSNFQLMQNYQSTRKGNLVYYVFDLLYLNGEDIRHYPLVKRKELLQQLLQKSQLTAVRYSDHVEEKGILFFKEAAKNHLEGIVCKNGQSHYRMKRSKEWLKVKSKTRQEVVIGGTLRPLKEHEKNLVLYS